MDVVKL